MTPILVLLLAFLNPVYLVRRPYIGGL